MAKESKAHWLSREAERFATPAITAVLISAIYFAVDFIVIEPEHQATIDRVAQAEKTQALLTENVAVLTKSTKSQTVSIQQLALDRAGGVYDGALAALERLEEKNGDKPVGQWSAGDQRLYEAAERQLRSAEARLGIAQGDTQ